MNQSHSVEVRFVVKDDGTAVISGLDKRFSGLSSTVARSNSSMESSVAVWSRFKSLVGPLLAGYGLMKLAGSFMEIGKSNESMRLRMNALLGSVSEGKKLFSDLADYAGKVPFELQEVADSATMLAGIMKGGSQEISKWMPLIGDLAAATGLSFMETTEQVMRILSAGAASADRFRERGVLGMLGFAAGVSYSAKESEKILWESWAKTDSKFKGLTTNLANTWSGTMSMYSDSWYKFITELQDAGAWDTMRQGAIDLLAKINELEKSGTLKVWSDNISSALSYATKGFFTLFDAIDKTMTLHDQFWSAMPESMGGGESKQSILENKIKEYDRLTTELQQLVESAKGNPPANPSTQDLYAMGRAAAKTSREDLFDPSGAQARSEQKAAALRAQIEDTQRKIAIVKSGIEYLEQPEKPKEPVTEPGGVRPKGPPEIDKKIVEAQKKTNDKLLSMRWDMAKGINDATMSEWELKDWQINQEYIQTLDKYAKEKLAIAEDFKSRKDLQTKYNAEIDTLIVGAATERDAKLAGLEADRTKAISEGMQKESEERAAQDEANKKRQDEYIKYHKQGTAEYIKLRMKEIQAEGANEAELWAAKLDMAKKYLPEYLAVLDTLSADERKYWDVGVKKGDSEQLGGWKIGVQEATGDFRTETEKWAEYGKQATDRLTTDFGNFANAATWDFDNIGETFRGMLQKMAQDFTSMAFEDMFKDIWKGISGGGTSDILGGIGDAVSWVGELFGGGGGGGGISVHHGGLITDGGVKKYHRGGLVPGRGPSLGILEGGEFVLPKYHFGGGVESLSDLLGQSFDTSTFASPFVSPPSNADYWDLPQFGFYGTPFMKTMGFEMDPNVTGGIPDYYYEKYGKEAEGKYLSEMMMGETERANIGAKVSMGHDTFYQMSTDRQGLQDALNWAFGGGLPIKGVDSSGKPLKDSLQYPYMFYSEWVAQKNAISMLAGMHLAEDQKGMLSRVPGAGPLPEITKREQASLLASLWNASFTAGGWPQMIPEDPLKPAKAHQGMLAPDDVPAILQKDEAVIPRKTVRKHRGLVEALLRDAVPFHEGGYAGGGPGPVGTAYPSVVINVQNKVPQVEVTRGPMVLSQGRMTTSIVIDELRRNPAMRRSIGLGG